MKGGIATSPAWAEYARQLGNVADTCALVEPLMPPSRVLEALEAVIGDNVCELTDSIGGSIVGVMNLAFRQVLDGGAPEQIIFGRELLAFGILTPDDFTKGIVADLRIPCVRVSHARLPPANVISIEDRITRRVACLDEIAKRVIRMVDGVI